MIRKNFIHVRGIFQGIGEDWADVPTREEYDDFRQRWGLVNNRIDHDISVLTDRITTLEKGRESEGSKENQKKTFVSDDYQITLEDNGTFHVFLSRFDLVIIYSPYDKNHWDRYSIDVSASKTSKTLAGLWLNKIQLKALHKALEVIGKQDLMDSEITFS